MYPDATTGLGALRRDEAIPEGYSVGGHLLRTFAVLVGIGSFSLWLAADATLLDWLLLPVFFVFANLLEWAFHRGPMHRPLGPRILYKNHTLIHHRAFGPHDMPIEKSREMGLILMPWYTMLLLFVLASPVAIVGALVRGPGLGGVFLVAACLYFIMYEGFHSLYHMPERVLRNLGLWENPVFLALQHHHRRHHYLDRMAHVNFNVTFPLMDWLLGTREKDLTQPVPAPVENPR
jgi:sterol desaturase/sphingolipid hydroxylase (fatty acid hydroxylase superfamily)